MPLKCWLMLPLNVYTLQYILHGVGKSRETVSGIPVSYRIHEPPGNNHIFIIYIIIKS